MTYQKYLAILILGIIIGFTGTTLLHSQEPSKFKVNDTVQTTTEWNSYYTPINGTVTDVGEVITSMDGNYEGRLISVDGGRMINEYWFEKVK